MTILKSFTKVRPDFARDTAQILTSKPPTQDTRWVIGGMMGSGKTSLAKRLASTWNIPHVEIDRFASPDEVVLFTLALPAGWVAEANPWQVPEEIWSHVDWIIFLDFDNVVNYWRLLHRGLAEWVSSGQLWNGFRKHIIHDTFKDLWRLDYLYGEANRAGWRRNGMGSGNVCAPCGCLRCISPREVELLISILSSKLPPKEN